MIEQTIDEYCKRNKIDINNLSYFDKRNIKRKLGYTTFNNKLNRWSKV